MTDDDVGILGTGLFVLGVVDGSGVDFDLVVLNIAEDALLEGGDFLFGHGVGFGDDGDEIDFGVKSSHEFDVDGFQPAMSLWRQYDTCGERGQRRTSDRSVR